jgi:hypothetical protein
MSSTTSTDELITRATQETDTIYVTSDEWAFVTPDGEGRYWYESLEEAQEQHGDDLPVVYADVDPWEF